MNHDTFVPRHRSREVAVGNLILGGDQPIRVQSMTSTHSEDVDGTVAQIRILEQAGCELVRVTVPRAQALGNVGMIRRLIGIPLICDIHFDYRMALGCLDEQCDKIRINPGNIGGTERFRQVVRKARDRGIPMRLGVNAGSLERDLVEKHGWPCPEAMVESALRYIELAEQERYDQIVVSLKSSNVPSVVRAYQLFAQQCNYPLHIGVTEAGTPPYGVTKSAVGLGAILLSGIGDTIRVSLLVDDKGDEVRAAFDILQATGRRVLKPEIIACPTCGRLEIDLQKIVGQVEERLKGRKTPIKISILGCVVNGPGEAREADIGIAAGRGKGVIFRRGEIVRHVSEDQMVDALLEEVERWDETAAPAALSDIKSAAPSMAFSLPVIQSSNA
jgi:(E)-4-hydroxy-3-methylbut-2-enyl-diphosphate synthase